MRFQISKEFRFESAHSLPHLPEGHKCRRYHGHSYLIRVHAEGELDRRGFCAGIDYSEMSDAVNLKVVKVLDHVDINHFIKPYSTAEYLGAWILDQITPLLPKVTRVDVHETSTSCVTVWRQ